MPCIIGICGIVFFKWQSYPIFWTIGWPICAMIVYWIIMWTVNESSLYEIIGDNCYYLGFVFTLTSLAVTLYLLHMIGDVEAQGQLPMREVISGFGVALSSTIVGIVLRVLMLRMSPDMAQQEGEARVDLDLAIRDFRTHLSMSIGELKRYSVETNQVLAEQRDAIRETLAQDADTHRQALESSTTAITRFSEETESRLSEHWAALEQGVTRDAEAYREAAQASVSAFREALEKIAETFFERHGSIREALQSSGGKYRQILESTVTDLRHVLGEAVQAFAEYREEASRLTSLSRRTFEQTGESAEAARTELERMKALTESIAVLSSESRGLDAALSGLADRLATVEDDIAAKFEPAVARMSEGATVVSAVLADSSGKFKSAAEHFEAITRFSEETESRLSEHWAALEQGVTRDAEAYREAAQASVSAFREALEEIAETFFERHGSIPEALQSSSGEYRQILESTVTDLRHVLGEAVQAFAEYREEASRLTSLSRRTFEQTGESAEAARTELERMKALAESIAVLSSESRGLDAALSGLAGRLATVEDGIAAKLEPAVARMSERATAISAVLADSSGKLKSAAERFEAAAEHTATADMQTNIAGAADRIADAVGKQEKANVALSAAIEKLGELADRRPEPSRGIGGIFSRNR